MLNLWKGSDKLEKLKSLLLRQSNLSVSGLTPNAFISIASSLIAEKNLRTLLIIPRDKTPEEIGEVFSSFSKKPAFSFPADFPSRQIDTLRALSEGRTDTVVTSLEALKSPLPTPDRFNKWHMKVRPGQSAYGKIIKELERGLYFRSDTVFETGEFARRGRVIDYWPPGEDNPIRILFEDDKILSISTFDSSTQRSLKKLDFAALYPAGFEEDAPSSLPQYLGKDILIVLLDDSVDCLSSELPPHSHCLNFSGLEESDLVFSSHTLEYSSSYSDAKKSMEALSRRGYKFIISAASEIERDKLLELIHDDLGIEAEGFISPIKEGFVSEDLKIAFYTPGDILPYRRTQIRPKAPKAYSVESFSDISPGDYLIHWKFGLGEYLGIEKKQHNDFESDFIKIGYRNNAVIYVAVENSGLIQKYAGKSFNVTLDSLSGRAWNKRKEKVRESVRELAKKLVNLYGARKEKGISFPLNPTLEADFASNFPYPLTPHQSLAIEEVLSDMESSEAMDRLICGDVGFGKTEVLMRAAFRAVINGYQVALLAPTTVLARQHFNVFRDRFSEFPVIIDMLSRLISPKDRKNVLKNISEGLTDIVVGTHGLLSENVNFPRIGLIIIDEEQRFGVEHKEALRFKYPEADLLTATATPIPRTLAMAMGKVKGFSLINTPPAGRQGVKTMVLPYNKQKIREAIIYEINRGGQIYFVHSRVGTIKETMRRLKELVPEASFDYIHGRMKAERIEKVMEDFINRKFNCLVSTTIIENGLDLPSVNTIIIEEANRLGLADIYQLRGRVGRSDIRAYCYLMYPTHIEMTGDMKDRFKALNSFSALGGGFQLALRDLQIRGAGELLGPKQHGNIMSVGFELYSEILKEEMASLRGEKYSSVPDIDISLPLTALIPETYIDAPEIRLALYRRLSSLRELEKLSEIEEEFNDRFGPIPEEVKNLLQIIELRIRASSAGVKSLAWSSGKLNISFVSGEKINLEVKNKTDIIDQVHKYLKDLKKLLSSD